MTVLVVGASSGIGRATALAFARNGARVMAAARRRDQLAELAKYCEISVADVSIAEQMQRLAQEAQAALGPLDVMVYAAGTNTPDRAMKNLSVETWDATVATNLNGAYYITRAVLPAMCERRSGHLIYISSIGGIIPSPGIVSAGMTSGAASMRTPRTIRSPAVP